MRWARTASMVHIRMLYVNSEGAPRCYCIACMPTRALRGMIVECGGRRRSIDAGAFEIDLLASHGV